MLICSLASASPFGFSGFLAAHTIFMLLGLWLCASAWDLLAALYGLCLTFGTPGAGFFFDDSVEAGAII